MELQTAFYIIGIVFMSIMLAILLALVVAVFIIKAKVSHIHAQIEEKLHTVTSVVGKVEAVGKKAVKTAKRALKK